MEGALPGQMALAGAHHDWRVESGPQAAPHHHLVSGGTPPQGCDSPGQYGSSGHTRQGTILSSSAQLLVETQSSLHNFRRAALVGPVGRERETTSR